MPEYTPSDVVHNSHLETQSTGSPPPSPPIIDATVDFDIKLSRKREREVSVEPATPKTDPLDIDSGRQENKERRTPAKKNRLHLDTTEEEEDVFPGSRTPSHSPPLGTSPPHEVKLRQISQGVEDLTWRNALHEGEPEITATSSNQTTDNSRSDFESDCVDKDKGLKRKFSSRAPAGDIQKHVGMEQMKRPRDDSDKEDNPRETKRPSPPPEPESASAKVPPSASKLTGFMAYASSSSPFALVKGQNIFSTIIKTPSSPTPSSTFPSGVGESSTSADKTLEGPKTGEGKPKSTGFESFLGLGSAFASATRPKSPPLSPGAGSKLSKNNKSPTRRTKSANVIAFSSYATGGAHGFHIPKRARAGSPSGGSSRSSLERSSSSNVFNFNGDSGEDEEEDRPVSFGEKLRAGRDDEDEVASDEEKRKLALEEQETVTGEEDEETTYQVRGKLFSLSSQNQWKERGTGTLKLNVRRFDGSGARLVMRKEAVYTLLLNVTLFAGMRCFLAQDPRYLRFSVIEGGVTVHYNLRVASAKIAQELLEEINSNIPSV